MANDEIKFLPIFQILDIKNIWFLLELEMALTTAIKKKFEPVCSLTSIWTVTRVRFFFLLVSALFSSLSTSFRQAGAIDESNFFCYLPCFAKSESLVQDIEKVAKEEAFNKFEAQLL